MVSDEEPRSGSRWEPAAAESPRSNADDATELHGSARVPETADRQADSTVAVAAVEHPAGAPRATKRRRAIAALLGAGLLLVGGGVGYAIGHATAAASGSAGTVRHGPGGFHDRPGVGRGGTAGGGAGTGAGNAGPGSST